MSVEATHTWQISLKTKGFRASSSEQNLVHAFHPCILQIKVRLCVGCGVVFFFFFFFFLFFFFFFFFFYKIVL